MITPEEVKAAWAECARLLNIKTEAEIAWLKAYKKASDLEKKWTEENMK